MRNVCRVLVSRVCVCVCLWPERMGRRSTNPTIKIITNIIVIIISIGDSDSERAHAFAD